MSDQDVLDEEAALYGDGGERETSKLVDASDQGRDPDVLDAVPGSDFDATHGNATDLGSEMETNISDFPPNAAGELDQDKPLDSNVEVGAVARNGQDDALLNIYHEADEIAGEETGIASALESSGRGAVELNEADLASGKVESGAGNDEGAEGTENLNSEAKDDNDDVEDTNDDEENDAGEEGDDDDDDDDEEDDDEEDFDIVINTGDEGGADGSAAAQPENQLGKVRLSGPGGSRWQRPGFTAPDRNAAAAGGAPVARPGGVLAMLPTPTVQVGPNQKSVYDIEFAKLTEKPWLDRGADITEYFNYGFNEDTWKLYCERQVQMRLEASMLAKIKTVGGPQQTRTQQLPSQVPEQQEMRYQGKVEPQLQQHQQHQLQLNQQQVQRQQHQQHQQQHQQQQQQQQHQQQQQQQQQQHQRQQQAVQAQQHQMMQQKMLHMQQASNAQASGQPALPGGQPGMPVGMRTMDMRQGQQPLQGSFGPGGVQQGGAQRGPQMPNMPPGVPPGMPFPFQPPFPMPGGGGRGAGPFPFTVPPGMAMPPGYTGMPPGGVPPGGLGRGGATPGVMGMPGFRPNGNVPAPGAGRISGNDDSGNQSYGGQQRPGSMPGPGSRFAPAPVQGGGLDNKDPRRHGTQQRGPGNDPRLAGGGSSDPRMQHMQPRSFGGPGEVGLAGGGPHDQGRGMGLMDDRPHDPRRGPPPVQGGGRFDDPRGQREDPRGFEDRRDDPRKRPHGGGRDGGYDERHKRGRW
jgi:Fip1 motif